MPTQLYWIDGPWLGKVALAARPRGGDWLQDEIVNWGRAGVNVVLSLLTAEEQKNLDLRNERDETERGGLEFVSFPILDRQVPQSEAVLGEVLETVNKKLTAGRNVVIHCRQGVGRSGLVAACLLVKNGMSPGSAIELISVARGVEVPETSQQREWIERYAPAFAK